MLPAAVVFVYLAIVLYVGIFAFRRGTDKKEDFFVANRSLGTVVFLLSVFGTNMTAFAILGSSGLAYRLGIGVYGLMASISGIVIPVCIFFFGTRLWYLGKRFGHVTQIQILRDRFEMNHIGTIVFILQAVMLVPYIIIGVMGGGETLEGVSSGAVPYWFGGLVVAVVVMSYVFFGGMRGTAWVNALQTTMFLIVGTLAFILISRSMGGVRETVEKMIGTYEKAASVAATQPATQPATPLNSPTLSDGALLTRDRIPFWYFVSYMFIPLSAMAFPHMAQMCLTAKKIDSFKKTVILYPLCIAAVWAPSVYLGALSGARPEVTADLAMRSTVAEAWLNGKAAPEKDGKPGAYAIETILLTSKDAAGKQLVADVRAGKYATEKLADTDLRAELRDRVTKIKDPALARELRQLSLTNQDGVMLSLLSIFTPSIIAGILGASIMAVVMASDSQILALSTMFAEDVFGHYGGTARFGEKAQVWSARVFVVLLTAVAYWVALSVHEWANIFEIAIQYAFSGFASMTPIFLGALFWKRATKWGVLASTLWIAALLVGPAVLQAQGSYVTPDAVRGMSAGDIKAKRLFVGAQD